MTAGLQVINNSNVVQIDESFRAYRLASVQSIAAARNGNWTRLQGVDIRDECPLIFARSTGWVGGADITNVDGTSGSVSVPTGVLFMFNSAPVDLAIFTSKGGAVVGASNVGLQTFDSSGNLIYASYYRYARIQTIVDASGSITSSSTGFADVGVQPWVCLNPLAPSLSAPLGGGSDLSYPPFMHIAQCTSGVLNLRYVENGDVLGALASDTKKSQYNGRRIQIPVAVIPGF